MKRFRNRWYQDSVQYCRCLSCLSPYIIQVADRLGLYNYLHENNVYAQVHYAPLHLMPYYQQWGNRKGDLPIVEEYYEHCLSLPMYPTLTDEEQEYVIEKVIEFVAK